MRYCNGVFEGGGVRGIGHVGAVCRLEQEGIRFVDLAGSSAGAIVAALLAAGYSGRELQQEMETLDYEAFKGKDFLDRLGTVGKALSLLFHFGVYDTDYLEAWVGELIERKQVITFGDVKKLGRKLKITASDLTDRKLLILPDSLEQFGILGDDFPVSRAVAMSASIPIFFEPAVLVDRDGKEHLVADGGLLSNYPMWVLEDSQLGGRRPTLGFRFSGEQKQENGRNENRKFGLAEYLMSIADTCMDAIDNSHISSEEGERTIWISTTITLNGGSRNIHATEFGISREESQALFENGSRAAERFLLQKNVL